MELWAYNLMQLRAVAAAARTGNVSRAAHEVGLTQPAVTHAIARVEARLGCRLFARHSAGVEALPPMVGLAMRIATALFHIGSARVTTVQMRALDALATHGSYVEAAAALGQAAPSLHRAIGDLAITTRKRLIERSGSALVVTPAAWRMVRSFRLAAAEFEAGIAEVAMLLGFETGTIVIGAMPLSRARLLPRAIVDFHAKHPEFTIRVVEGAYLDLVEPLRDGAIDIMVGALRPVPRGLISEALFDDRPVVVARAGHPLSGIRATSADLRAYPWAMPAPDAPLRQLWQALFSDHEPPRVPIECGSVLTVREVLRATDFLTLLSPDQIAAERAAGWLVPIDCMTPASTRTIGLTSRTDWHPTPLQARFVDTMRTAAA